MKQYIIGLALAMACSAGIARTVEGRVVDAATGNPVSGAMVTAEGDKASALTDDNGQYKLEVADFVTALKVSGPSYNMVKLGLTAGGEQKTVKLLSNAFAADYSATEDVLGSKTAEAFQYSNAVNMKEDLQKQLAAYGFMTSRGGNPGIGLSMFMQGLNSLNANAQPLVVLDGVILDQQYSREMLHDGFFNDVLTNISVADIESVTVMRNGTALYGARGANGVILIKTHRSGSLETKITARAAIGVTTEPKYLEMMDAEQYRGYASELLKGTGTRVTDFKFLNADPNYYYYNQYHNETDWKEGLYQTAVNQNYGINVEGGDDIAQYSLSVGFAKNEHTLKFNEMNRVNVRFNTDIELYKQLKVRFDCSFSNVTRNMRNDGAPLQYDEGTPTSPSFLGYAKAPFLSAYAYGAGKLSDTYFDVNDESYLSEALANFSNYNYKLGNPRAINEYGEAENKNHLENSLLNITVIPSYKFKHNISVSQLFSYTLVNTNNKYYIPINGVPSYYVASVSAYRENEVRSLASKQQSVQLDSRVAWNKQVNGHAIDAFGGVRINFENYTRNAQLGYNTGSDKTPFMKASLMNAQSDGDNDLWRTMDIYAQANYAYRGKYLAQLNLTGTGSSRFGVDADGLKIGGVVWGVFPAAQLGWVMTNENWFSKDSKLDYLRLTAGYDMSGNDDLGNLASRSYFRAQMFYNEVSGLSFDGIGNTEIKWETTNRINAGVEARAFDNRLNLGMNLFHSKTTDLLSLQTLGFLSGLESNWTNAGALTNNGFDLNVSGKPLVTKNWSWQLGFSVGHYKNEITELANNANAYNTDVMGATIRTEVGSAANLFYGYKTRGVFSTTEEANAEALYLMDANGVDKHYFGAGDVKFVDKDGNHEINENDREVIGDPNPDLYGNIFTSLAYKRFKLDVNFNYVYGNDVFNYMRMQLESGSRFMNQTLAMTQRWQMEGQQTSVPKASFQDAMGNSRFSDRWIEDGSYLRLKNVTLSYDLPINNQYIQGVQFWVEANNLFTATKYLGTDPEVSTTNSVIGQGIDLGRVGLSRSFMAGVKIDL